MNAFQAMRDVVLVIVIAWLGTSILTREVLGWHRQPADAPITWADLLVLMFYLAWVLASAFVMQLARRRNRSGWCWFLAAHAVSPPIAWLVLLMVSRRTMDKPETSTPRAGRWQFWSSSTEKAGGPNTLPVMRKTSVATVALAVITVVTIAVWWWMRPAPETLTERLWRECHDTFAYTHPEWDERYLDNMTKRCMDRRLLEAR